uniref:Uncharacterized protein n=1 Tax=Anguilla anguilla TaxID=7936 RepID=A0A0E9WBF7_ANGAN
MKTRLIYFGIDLAHHCVCKLLIGELIVSSSKH